MIQEPYSFYSPPNVVCFCMCKIRQVVQFIMHIIHEIGRSKFMLFIITWNVKVLQACCRDENVRKRTSKNTIQAITSNFLGKKNLSRGSGPPPRQCALYRTRYILDKIKFETGLEIIARYQHWLHGSSPDEPHMQNCTLFFFWNNSILTTKLLSHHSLIKVQNQISTTSISGSLWDPFGAWVS